MVEGVVPTTDAERIHARRWVTLGVLCLSLLIIVMDNTILNVAIPSLIHDLDASNSEIQWIIDAYTLVFAGLLLTTGSLSDRFGRKGALQAGIVLFAIGSASAALSTTTIHLIASRAFMGIGGALIMPATLSILTNVFRDPRERGRAIAIWAGFSGLAVAIGPVTGGLLLRHFEWSSVFWVNLPIGAVALVAGYFLVPTSRDPHQGTPRPGRRRAVDRRSRCAAVRDHRGPDVRLDRSDRAGGFGLGVTVLATFIAWELHTPNPMLDMRFFKNPRFTAANSAITLTFFALFGSMFLMTQYWQFVHGYWPLGAGLADDPLRLHDDAHGAAVRPHRRACRHQAGGHDRAADHLHGAVRALVPAGDDAVSAGDRAVLRDGRRHGDDDGAGDGVGDGLAPPNKAGVGSAVNDTTRQVGGALGVAVIGSVVSSVYATNVSRRGRTLRRAGGGARAVAGIAGRRARGGQRASAATPPRSSATSRTPSSTRSATVCGSARVIILGAAFVAWRFLPARAQDPLAIDAVRDRRPALVAVPAGGS